MTRRSTTALKPSKPKAHTFTWRHLTCTVKATPNYLGTDTMLELRVVAPKGCPAPITSSGYRSEFANPETITEAGGPIAYMTRLMDAEATTKTYKDADYRWRQGDLFAKTPTRGGRR